MRTALLSLFLAVPALGQTWPAALPPIDVATGRGSVSRQYVRQEMHLPDSDYPAFANRIAWYFVHYEDTGGEITITPGGGGKPITVEAPNRAIQRTAIPLGSSASAAGVVFTGYAGGPITTGTVPKVGDPYTGELRQYPPGSTAVWSKPIKRERFVPVDGIVGVLTP
jgi:hypothetical protein